ncbi:hypothetical protein DF220_02720 [Salinibacterium hongtaonis]|uniref:Uncharacterized protein n=1 Tax=Homoserinimonas hongtaonis TaxID=2079791 RepID=A0A2U1SZ06_9MICO|nr:hypothetical protein DF220_02720 [Salinibacterium hongtaonis]
MVALAGCSPAEGATPSPTPSVPKPSPSEPAPSPSPSPAPEGTFITPAGLGTLRVGHPAAESELVKYVPDYCLQIMGESFAWDPARWIPVDEGYDFSTYVDTQGIVQIIDVRTSKFTTPEGFAVGQRVGVDIRDKHPRLKLGVGAIESTMEYVSTPDGNLGFELGTSPDLESYNAADVVLNIQITAPGVEPYGWNSSDAIAGGCV